MRPRLRFALMVVCIVWAAILCATGSLSLVGQAQEESAAEALLDLVNETRLDEGLNPCAESRLLTSAAQRHADDLAENGLTDADDGDVHRGSDGSDEQNRIEEAGYAAWTEDDDQMVVAESVWAGQGTPEEALAALLENEGYRQNLLNTIYREVGIGVSTDADGRRIYVLDFGARPNVLPIFINDGAASTENREVAIRLTNEEARPEGEGATFMGEAIEIRISSQPTFEELAWQPWAPLVSWVLPDTSGEHTIYVQFRDAAGRTAASSDSIFLDEGTPATPTVASGSPTSTPQASDAAAPPSPTSESTATQEPEPSASPSGVPTAPSTSVPLVPRATPFPTWTPLPSPGPTPTDLDESGEAVFSPPSLGGYGRPLAAVGILQGVVIVLGIYWVMRRGKGA